MRSGQQSNWDYKYLAQGHKHVGTSGAPTDGLVILSPALFSTRPHALSDHKRSLIIIIIIIITLPFKKLYIYVNDEYGVWKDGEIHVGLGYAHRMCGFVPSTAHGC